MTPAAGAHVAPATNYRDRLALSKGCMNIGSDINLQPMDEPQRKKITFLGGSSAQIRSFPESAKKDAGFQLDMVQQGLESQTTGSR